MKLKLKRIERAARLRRTESAVMTGLLTGLMVGSYVAVMTGSGTVFWCIVIGYCAMVIVTRSVVALLAR